MKVHSFKEKISSLGIYTEFDTRENLKTKVVVALHKAVERLRGRVVEKGRDTNQKTQDVSNGSANVNPLTKVSEFDEDIGLMELSELTVDAVESFNDILGTLATETEKLGSRISAGTDDLKALTPTGDLRQDQKSAKKIIEKIAAETQRYSHILDQGIPNARGEFSSALRYMQQTVIISLQDGMSSAGESKILVDELEALKVTISTVHEQTSGFQKAISSTPRMTSKLNQAKRRTTSSIGDLLGLLSDALDNIDATLVAIKNEPVL